MVRARNGAYHCSKSKRRNRPNGYWTEGVRFSESGTDSSFAVISEEHQSPYALLGGGGLHDVARERNPERFGDLLIEHHLLDRNFLERDIARVLAAKDARKNF
jgi:hypothetical protein